MLNSHCVRCFVAFALTPRINAETTLRSPWDSSNVKLTDAPYACPEPVHLSADLTTDGFYSDSKSSVIDPAKWKAYSESSGPYKKLGDEAVAAADAYRTTGSRAAASCVLKLLKRRLLMVSSQERCHRARRTTFKGG